VIDIVDHGVGNLAGLERALRRAGARDVRVTRSHVEILAARAIVLLAVRSARSGSELRR
jgi:imidazoleglycerol phosphate synthase glutamine amidotransferase subunit HisH